MHILSFDPSRLRGHPSAGRKQMLGAFTLVGLRCMFHRKSIHYSIGETLVNRSFPTEFLQGRDLLVSLQGVVVHVCTWPGM